MAAKAKAKRKRVERVIRFPGPMYDRLRRHAHRRAAEDHHQPSINAEVLRAVEAHLDREENGNAEE